MARDLMHLMNSMLHAAGRTSGDVSWRPAADVYRTSKGWLLKFELAGVRPEDIEVSVHGTRLTVRGTRRDSCITETCSCHLMEITYSRFERSVELPEQVQPARVRAEHRDGMLLIHIEREVEA
jgi:HSP20 family protein